MFVKEKKKHTHTHKNKVVYGATPGSNAQYMAIVSICTTAVGAAWALFRSYAYHKREKEKELKRQEQLRILRYFVCTHTNTQTYKHTHILKDTLKR